MDALHQAGQGFAPELVRITSGRQPAEDHAALDALLALPEPPTAIACANDSRALAVLDGCRRRGLRVPDDLAVVGADNLPAAALAQPPLTTVDGCHREQGGVLADWLARRLTGEKLPVGAHHITPRLLVRNST
jgi:DNA-binding LacI/PurR family transcriptional regulator